MTCIFEEIGALGNIVTDKEQLIQAVRKRYDAILVSPYKPAKIPERLRRLWAAMIVQELEKQELRQGIVKLVGEAIKMSPTTVRRGLRELQELQAGRAGNFSLGRSPGGGRKKKATIQIDALEELQTLIELVTLDDSESPLP